MKVRGRNKVEINYEGKYQQPFPTGDVEILVAGVKVDLAIVIGEVVFMIDGKKYGGQLQYLLAEMDN